MKTKELICLLTVITIQIVSLGINIFAAAVSKSMFLVYIAAMIVNILTVLFIFKLRPITLIIVGVTSVTCLAAAVVVIMRGETVSITKYNINILYYLFYYFAENITCVIFIIKLILLEKRYSDKTQLTTVDYTLLLN